MQILLIIIAILTAYGSLYPFDFQWPDAGRIAAITTPGFDLFATTRGDVLGNVALFIPFGFVGILSMSQTLGRRPRFLAVLVGGALLAFVLQVAQLFLPSRDPAMLDVVWNTVGISFGAVFAFSPAVRRLALFDRGTVNLDVPQLLAAIWILSQLIPFVPSLDLQLVKDSLKPLFFQPRFRLGESLLNLGAWLVALRFLASSQIPSRAAKVLPGLPVAVLALQPFIIGNDVTLPETLGAVGASIIWFILGSGLRPTMLALLLAAGILAAGLSGLDFDARRNDFGWIPFTGFLEGGMLVNSIAICRKVFLYGALTWLLQEGGLGWRKSTAAAVVFLGAIEAMQVFVTGARSEITDPILAVLVVVAMRAVSHSRVPLRVDTHGIGALDARVSSASAAQAVQRSGPSGLERLSSLDGLRGVAALSVFGVHFNQAVHLQWQYGAFDLDRLLTNGNTGVGLFFVLSGFLLSIPFWSAHHDPSKPVDAIAYSLRRIARILPAYYACVFGIVLIKGFSEGLPGTLDILSHLLFLHNLSERHVFSMNPAFWTLAVEMQFYLLLPLLFLALRPMWSGIAFCVVVALCLGTYLANYELISSLIARGQWPVDIGLGALTVHVSYPDSGVLRYSTLGHLTFFLFGVATAWLFLRSDKPVAAVRDRPRPVMDAVFWVSAFACILILSTPLDDLLEFPFGHYNWPFVPLLLSALVLAGPSARSARALLDWQPVRWLGIVSYGVYIYHWPMQRLTAKLMDKASLSVVENWIIFGMASLAATLLLAVASYALIERPILQAARRWRALRDTSSVIERPSTPSSWSALSVELSADHVDYLGKLAQKTGRSLSGATRLVIGEFIAELGDATSLSTQGYRLPDQSIQRAAFTAPPGLPHIVNLHVDQIQFLADLSKRLGVDASRTVRMIVDEFISKRIDRAAHTREDGIE